MTCSIRIWKQPHVKIDGRYALLEGEIEVTGLQEISLRDITPKLAKRSGFASVAALMKIAKRGRGERIFPVEFHYLAPGLERRWVKIWIKRRATDFSGFPASLC